MRPIHVALTLAAALVLASLPAQVGVKYKVLHNFGSGKDGDGPNGPLVLDVRGDLYGVTIGGGDGCRGGCGTVFQLTPRTRGVWGETILYNFPGGNYSYPGGVLTLDGRGDIYGTMAGYKGGVFELSSSSGDYSFSALYTDAAGPGLLMDELGNPYGKMGPGRCGAGAIGELSPGSGGWTYTLLHSLCDSDGSDPPAPPIWDGKGNMFGTTTYGGFYSQRCLPYYTRGCGVIYEMTPNGEGTWTYHALHRFFQSSTVDGRNPYGGLVMDKAGNIYGGTWAGGRYDLGTVFKLAYSGGRWKEIILYSFPDCAHGCGVDGALAVDKSGNLYGTAAGGPGSCDGLTCGVVFKLSRQKNGKWKYSVVYNFTSEGGGAAPFYGVIMDGKGHLFGVTSKFGKYGGGTAFEIIP